LFISTARTTKPFSGREEVKKEQNLKNFNLEYWNQVGIWNTGDKKQGI
jgi:hypothetical protein